MQKTKLGVNIDHVATVRNARGSSYPDPVRAAIIAQEAGADVITAHLREDRRHIVDQDIASIIKAIAIEAKALIPKLKYLSNWNLDKK